MMVCYEFGPRNFLRKSFRKKSLMVCYDFSHRNFSHYWCLVWKEIQRCFIIFTIETLLYLFLCPDFPHDRIDQNMIFITISAILSLIIARAI